MRILIGCEFSGIVRNAFLEKGHDVWSCDLLPSEDDSRRHIQADVLTLLGDDWDLAIFHPPCQYLASSGLHWNKRIEGRSEKTFEALFFVAQLMSASIPRIAIENPVGCISTVICKPDQIVQPWWFGDDASKKTCLWLKNLPPLVATNRLPGDNKTRRANQTASGQNKLAPSPDRWKERSRTYQGIANCMADTWWKLE